MLSLTSDFQAEFTACVICLCIFSPQSGWLAGEFRDCNGESNGRPLSCAVLRCDTPDTETSRMFCDRIELAEVEAGGKAAPPELLGIQQDLGDTRGDKVPVAVEPSRHRLGRQIRSPRTYK